MLKGTSKNRSYSSDATKLSANDSASFPFRFMDVHARAARDPHREQFFEVPIFPGGYIPALSEVLPAVERAGLLVTDIEILRLHYAETLKAWRERFLAHREDAEPLYDERFVRMWEFYLASSEMTFREQGMMVFQLQLTRRQGVVP